LIQKSGDKANTLFDFGTWTLIGTITNNINRVPALRTAPRITSENRAKNMIAP